MPGRNRRADRDRHQLLLAGEAVDLLCRLRHTSARGWSPWITGVLTLSAAGDSSAPQFVADSPAQASLISGRAGRVRPFELVGPVRITRRRVRFKTEAFYDGMDGVVIVLTGEPDDIDSATSTEVALPLDEVDAVLDRLIILGINHQG